MLNINEPRIYFGLETNDTVGNQLAIARKSLIIQTEDALKNTENVYDGDAGFKSKFLR